LVERGFGYVVVIGHVDQVRMGIRFNVVDFEFPKWRYREPLFLPRRPLYCRFEFLFVSHLSLLLPHGFCTDRELSRDRTVQFVGISAFHTQIADPLIGGTYMTARLMPTRPGLTNPC
jgi:hypothetical protein